MPTNRELAKHLKDDGAIESAIRREGGRIAFERALGNEPEAPKPERTGVKFTSPKPEPKKDAGKGGLAE